MWCCLGFSAFPGVETGLGSFEGLLAPPAMGGAEFCLKFDLWALFLAPNLELAVTGVAADGAEEPL